MRRAQRAFSEHRGYEQAACHAGRSASAQQLSEDREGDTGDAVSTPRLNGQAWLSSSLRRPPAECARTPGMGRSNPNRSTRNRTGRPGRPGCGRGRLSRTESTSPTLVQRACREISGLRLLCHRRLPPHGCLDAGFVLWHDEATTWSSCVFRRSSCFRAGFRLPAGGVHPIRPSPDHGDLRRVRIWHGVCIRFPARAERQPVAATGNRAHASEVCGSDDSRRRSGTGGGGARSGRVR